jgi:hypothetical protein
VPVICDAVEEVDAAQIHAEKTARGGSGGIHGRKSGN